MHAIELSQDGATTTLNLATVGWAVKDYAQHQVQISGLTSGQTATLYTISPESRTGQWVEVKEVSGTDAAAHMIVLTPDSGRHANLKIEFSASGGSALIVLNSHYSASHHFAL